MKKVLAIDLGSSSGRAIKGEYQDGMLTYREIYRFPNQPVQRDRYLCWDFERLMREIRQAIHLAGDIDSVGVDAWGADFGVLDEKGQLLMPVVHYRDPRTEGMMAKAQKIIPEEKLFQMCGNQSYATNSLYQILALKEREPEIYARTAKILHVSDLVHFFLCGNAVCERTIACTTQLLEPVSRSWNEEVLQAFQIPLELFANLADSGTIVGVYSDPEERSVRKKQIYVTAVAGHDTQSAGAAMTEDPEHTAFLNIGTWSLLGIERQSPVLTELGFRKGISNEQGPYGGIHCIINIVGTWLLQECRAEWGRLGELYSYEELEGLAEAAVSCGSFFDPNDNAFSRPGNMPEKIRAYCRETGQRIPETKGEIVRCIYESLARKYREGLVKLEQGSGMNIRKLQILGGGVRSRMLCRLTEEFCQREVTTGPMEATALGNLSLQLLAMGELSDSKDARKVIKNARVLEKS